MELALAILLLAFSAFFSGSETAFTSLTLIDQKVLENKKGSRAKTALYFCKHPDLLITTVLIGNDLVNVALSALVTKMTIEKFGNPYVGATTGILTLILLVFGEVSPKQIAMYRNLPIALAVAIPLRALSILLFPVIWLFSRLTLLIHLVFGPSGRGKLTEDGLRHVTDAAEDAGVVDEYENDLMQRAIHFSETQVKAIMTHRTEVFSLSDSMTYREAYSRIVQSGFSRIPVYHGSRENITGVLLLKELLRKDVNAKGHLDQPLSSLAQKPHFVPESMHMDDLFFQFKHQKQKIAIALDEYGGFSGVVTMEDIVEQMFGELYDEQESYQGELMVKSSSYPGSYVVQAEMPFMSLADSFDLHPSKEEDTDGTVAGYLLDIIGDIPKVGQVTETRYGTFRILTMTRNRMDTVLFTPKKEEEEKETED